MPLFFWFTYIYSIYVQCSALGVQDCCPVDPHQAALEEDQLHPSHISRHLRILYNTNTKYLITIPKNKFLLYYFIVCRQ